MHKNDTINDYMVSDDELKKNKNEFNRFSFREKLDEELVCICVNCGSNKNLSYHHIVPLSLGGTNNLSNIVRLCPTCHDKAHLGYNDIKKIGIFKAVQNNNLGRKRLVELDDDTVNILDRYFNCEIGTLETKQLLGMSPNNKSTWDRIRKEYREKYNIPDTFRNYIDLKNSQQQRGETLARAAQGDPIKYDMRVENVLHKYFKCEIGRKEAKSIIGINPKTQS